MNLIIFVLGAFRSLDNSTHDIDKLKRIRDRLIAEGYDAFLSFDKDSVLGNAFAQLPPRQKTLKLVQTSDLNLFVFTRSGIRDGVVSELTEIQVRFPHLSEKHVVLIESGLQLSSIIDQSQGGIMSVPPIKQLFFDDENELLEIAAQVAFNFNSARAEGYKP